MNESGEQDDKEKEMEENMAEVMMSGTLASLHSNTQVSATIVNLRNMANDIGNTTKAQNETMDRWSPAQCDAGCMTQCHDVMMS